MATHDYIISNASGAAVRADLNNALAAIATNNSSATEPTTTYAYQWWADTGSSPTVMKLRNSANSDWVTLFQLDGEWSVIPFENGSAAAPSIYFKDSGTDTGLFSGGTDKVNVTTGGVERVEWGTSEVVFNDGGNNYDFRVEGDTDANLLFVDASSDRVGIGLTSLGAKLHVRAANSDTLEDLLRLEQFNAAGTDSARLEIRADAANNLVFYHSTGLNAGGHVFETSNTERMRISAAGNIFFPSVSTTASSANAFLNSGSSPANQLLRSTSSLRYKTEIENIEQQRSGSILDFRPVWYRSTADADRKDWSWYGLIAEEVAEIEPRLVHWTYLDDAYEEVDGKKQLKPDAEMVPDGVQYDRLTVLLLDVVKRQQQAIETLEAKVAALKTA